LTPTNYQPIAPVVRYGTSRRILDGQAVSSAAQAQVNFARNAAPAPQQQAPETRSAAQEQQEAAPQPQQAPQQQEQPQLRSGPIRPLTLRPESHQQNAPQQQPEQPQQAQPEARAAAPQDDAIVVGGDGNFCANQNQGEFPGGSFG